MCSIRAKYLVNCAGGFADKIARMVGDESFTIKPRLGEYVLVRLFMESHVYLCIESAFLDGSTFLI